MKKVLRVSEICMSVHHIKLLFYKLWMYEYRFRYKQLDYVDCP